MKYMLHIPLTPDSFHDRVARFLDTGAPPPAGVTMLGRWHGLGLDVVYVLVEADEPKAVYLWAAQWSDIFEFEVVPVIEDEEAAEMLSSLPR